MDREGGYIKLYRSLESSEDFVGLRADQCWVAVRIVQLANYKPGLHRFRGQAIQVDRGELAHTLETIAERSNSTIKVVRTTVSRLMKSGFLGSRTGTVAGTAYRVLVVRNYEKFQGHDDDTGTVAGTALGSERAATGHGPGSDRALREEGEEREEREEVFALGAGAPPPTRGPRKPKRGDTDPRFAPLRTAWEAEFQTARGEPYRWEGQKDATAVHRLIAIPVAEFVARARRGLAAVGYHRCDSVSQLAMKWNGLAGGTAGPRAVTVPAQPASAFRGGRVDFTKEVT